MKRRIHIVLLTIAVGATSIGCGHSDPARESAANAAETSSPAGGAPDESTAGSANNRSVSAHAATESTIEQDESGRVTEKTFDDIKFEIGPNETFNREMLTSEIEALFGKSIRIRGYMLPAMRRKGLKSFVLVRDNQECCFGPGAALYDCVLVHMESGKTTDYSIRPVAVEGTFRFEELQDPITGRHLAVFQLEGTSVE